MFLQVLHHISLPYFLSLPCPVHPNTHTHTDIHSTHTRPIAPLLHSPATRLCGRIPVCSLCSYFCGLTHRLAKCWACDPARKPDPKCQPQEDSSESSDGCGPCIGSLAKLTEISRAFLVSDCPHGIVNNQKKAANKPSLCVTFTGQKYHRHSNNCQEPQHCIQ